MKGDIPGVPPMDPKRSVDGERGIEILKELPVSSKGLDLEVRQRIIGVYDKGGNMIVEGEQELIDMITKTVYHKITSMIVGIGQGGYNGPRGPSKPSQTLPTRHPDATQTVKTTPEMPFLYRLCGDYNPLHADEEFGQGSGFKGSINHGLLSWNIAAHSVLRQLGGSDPRRLRAFGARYKNVVYPGDELETRMWVTGTDAACDMVAFEATVKSDGRIAL